MLTVEKLKALQVGDWVWLVVLKEDRINKAHHGKYYHIHEPLEELADKELWCGWQGYSTAFEYKDYGTKWLAYKNKEEAETKEEDNYEYKYLALKAAIFEVCVKLNNRKYNEDFYRITTGSKIQRIESLEEEILKEGLAKLRKEQI